ncbi:hypothetical protein ACWDA9_36120, partial [Streptomyces sp. NPDC001193]
MGVRAVQAALRTAVALCLVTTLVHVVLVFLHVAPAEHQAVHVRRDSGEHPPRRGGEPLGPLRAHEV